MIDNRLQQHDAPLHKKGYGTLGFVSTVSDVVVMGGGGVTGGTANRGVGGDSDTSPISSDHKKVESGVPNTTPDAKKQALIELRRANVAKAREKLRLKRLGGGSEKTPTVEKKEEAAPVYKKIEKKVPKVKGSKRLEILSSTNTEQNETTVSNSQVLNITLSAKQGEALKSPSKFLLYGGAKGGGKSWFICIWMFLMAVKYRGNKLFFCRRRSVDFTNTTLETWKKSIPSNLYRINEQKKKIFIDRSNSVIDYGGLDDPLLIQSLNSAEYAHISIDQAEEVEQDSFSMIRGTLRHKLPDGTFPPYQVRLTANPAQCWLKDKFILAPDPDFAFISALPSDNPHLPKDYTENLREAFKHRPNLLAAYLYGSWDDLAGHNVCIQGSWINEAKKRKSEDRAIKRIIVNDPARFGDDENVIYVMEDDGRVMSVVEQIFLEHKSLMDTAGRLASLRRKWDAQIIAVDVIGIGAGIVDALYELKEPVLSINSSSKPTIENKQRKYMNLRSQLWMEAGELFANSRVSLPEDNVLSGQLAGIKFDYNSSGKIQVESKEDIKKRLSRSPDRGDCFVMGLFALEYVQGLSEKEYSEVSGDRQGAGERVLTPQSELVGVGDDFSGYNL